jgi:hypothetical protein
VLAVLASSPRWLREGEVAKIFSPIPAQIFWLLKWNPSGTGSLTACLLFTSGELKKAERTAGEEQERLKAEWYLTVYQRRRLECSPTLKTNTHKHDCDELLCPVWKS